MKIFHHNDMDGYASLYITASSLGFVEYPYDRSKFIKINYESDVADKFAVAHDEDVYIVDYSFTESTMDQLVGLLERGCRVTWIDHHDSSIRLINSHPELNDIPGVRNNSLSGAALCYLYLYRSMSSNIDKSKIELCPNWIKYVSDYDTWTHSYSESEYFKVGFDLYKDKYSLIQHIIDNGIGNCVQSGGVTTVDLIEIGKVVKGYIDTDNEVYCSSYAYETRMSDGTLALFCNKRSNSWLFGDKIDKYPICISGVFNGSEWIYSLFSQDPTVNCAKYAEVYGGGGHPGAAGFRSKELVFKKI